MTDSILAMPMLARRTDDGVSVNESAVCWICADSGDGLLASYENWLSAEDVSGRGDDELYPVDNPDAICNGCGAHTLWERD